MMKASFDLKMTETSLQSHFVQIAQLGGWAGYHVRRSDRVSDGIWKRDGYGFPDWVLCHIKTGRTIWVELKSEHGRLTPHQIRWLSLLAQMGEVYVWKPSNWADIVKVLLYNGVAQTWSETRD